MYSIATKYLVLSYLLFCMLLCTLLCALTLFPSLVNYSNFAYTAYASEMSSSDNNLREDRPYAPAGTLEDKFQKSSQPIINDPNLKLELVSEGPLTYTDGLHRTK